MSDSETIQRFVPPVAHVDQPKVGGAIGPSPEDFVVDEIPAYLPSGDGPHWLARLRKTGRTTAELVRAVADAAGVRERDVGVAGMKDKRAVTTQWLSVPRDDAREPEQWVLPEELELLEAAPHGNKLRRGHLRGNRFAIRLVGVEGPADVGSTLDALIDRIERDGVPNYFGAQRFGVRDNNLGDAIEWLRAGGRGGRAGRDRTLRKLYPSVLQSEIFNRYLRTRDEDEPRTLMEGEVVRLDGSTRSFVVEDAAAEEPRRVARDVHPTGPLPGPKMRVSAARPAEIEREAIASLGLEPAVFATLGKHAPGSRRDLYLYPADLAGRVGADGSVTVEFGLGAGGYATEIVRAIAGTDERARS